MGRKIVTSLTAFPLLLLVAHLPEAGLTLLQKFVEDILESKPILGFVILFPLFCLSSSLSGSLTFLLVLQQEENLTPSLKTAWERLKTRLPQLLLASLTIGALFVLGLAALVLPAIYFLAIYLFVPHIILTSEKASLSSHLYASKKLVTQNRRALLHTMSLILATIVIGLLAYLAGQKCGEWTASLSAQPPVQGVLSTGLDVLFSMLGGSLVDVWLSHFFLNLKAKVANESNR